MKYWGESGNLFGEVRLLILSEWIFFLFRLLFYIKYGSDKMVY